MCEANAYLIEGDQKKLVMKAVETLEPEGDNLLLRSIFGEQKLLKAQVHSLEMAGNNIFLERTE